MQSLIDTTKRRILIIDDNSRIHEDYRKILAASSSTSDEMEADFMAFLGETPKPGTTSEQLESPLRDLIQLDSAMQGQEGLEMVKQAIAESSPYSLAFVDLRMPPGWDGLRTIEELWKVAPDLQVVICSAYSDNAYNDICDRLGQTDSLLILKKPFDAVEVYQLAVALTEKWLLSRKARLKQADLEELVELRTVELKKASLHDPMTKLANRTKFNDRLKESLKRTRRYQLKTGLYLIDIDYFKQINDSLGHPAGDELLVEVGRRLVECMRDTDTAARLGGDEFAIVQTDVKDISEFRAVLKRLEEILSRPYTLDDRYVDVSFSIGAAVAPNDATNADLLLRKADLALYRSKKDGRSTSRFYESEMDYDLANFQEITHNLKAGLAKNQFDLYYQPIVAADTGALQSMEALLRWTHPTIGTIPPDEFIPTAEETGIIAQIGEWVLATACQTAVSWPKDVKVAVNVSPIQFRSRYELIPCVARVLAETGLEPERLEIEITETSLLGNSDQTIEKLNQLQEIGVSIVLDDFGMGHSSLNYVQSFPFDKLKLDRSFVSSKFATEKTRAILKLVGGLGVNLDIVTTAEGVETAEELAIVQAEGFRQIQGYLIGRPTPGPELGQFFEKDRLLPVQS